MSQTTIGSVSLGLDPAPLPLEALCGSGEEKSPQAAPPGLNLPQVLSSAPPWPAGRGRPLPAEPSQRSEPWRAPGMPKRDAEAQPSQGNTQPRAVLHPRGGPGLWNCDPGPRRALRNRFRGFVFPRSTPPFPVI